MEKQEHPLQPQPLGTTPHVRRRQPCDIVCVGLIVLLAAMLTPSLGVRWLDLQPGAVDADRAAHVQDVFGDVVSRLSSFYLLPAMGMLLALRCKAIDLSVWASAGLGGVVAAAIVNSGGGVALSLAGAVAAGLAVGTVNAVAVATTRRPPTWLITLVTASLAVWAAQAVAGGARTLAVPQGLFSEWRLSPAVTRMLMVAAMYSLTMIAMILWRWRGGRSSRRRAAVGLLVSGVLSAAGGAVWLVEYGCAPVPTRVIGDLRIPAAAVLAGAVILTGPGRSLLAGLLLPISMLLVTLWRQEVRSWQWFQASGYAFQLAELAAMVLTVQAAFCAAFRAASPGRRRFLAICGIKAAVALGIVAFQASRQSYQLRHTLHVVGVVVWLHALGALSLPSLRRAVSPVWSKLRQLRGE